MSKATTLAPARRQNLRIGAYTCRGQIQVSPVASWTQSRLERSMAMSLILAVAGEGRASQFTR